MTQGSWAHVFIEMARRAACRILDAHPYAQLLRLDLQHDLRADNIELCVAFVPAAGGAGSLVEVVSRRTLYDRGYGATAYQMPDMLRMFAPIWEIEYYEAAQRPLQRALLDRMRRQSVDYSTFIRAAADVPARQLDCHFSQAIADAHRAICQMRRVPATQRYVRPGPMSVAMVNPEDAMRPMVELRYYTRTERLQELRDQMRQLVTGYLDGPAMRGLLDAAEQERLILALSQSPFHDSFEDPRDEDRYREMHEAYSFGIWGGGGGGGSARAMAGYNGAAYLGGGGGGVSGPWRDEANDPRWRMDVQWGHHVFRAEYFGEHFRHDAEHAKQQAEAEARGMKLLLENLTAEQRKCYEKNKFFHVKGCDTGTWYRIKHGRQQNVYALASRRIYDKALPIIGYCFVPDGYLVAGDVMLAQKTALELFETKALKVANKFPVYLP